jgi:hypothetical protein
MPPLTALRFDNSYARLHPAFYQVVDPAGLPDPRLVAFNPDAAALIDLDPGAKGDPDAPAYLSGSKRLPGAEPLAQAYAGHQFGVWVPQLGDGRAFLLGEVKNARGESWDLHLKGGGQTRYSRFGDGRSVLRSAIREYLASEALHGLGIPTTRALCVVGSDLPVQRESLETAATIIRLAPSHVRFGTFEYFASLGAVERVHELADYVIARHFPELPAGGRRALFVEVVERTARLLARWLAAGFAHGVMNTDNMSILGVTLDYGPYGFLDDYHAGFICNHTDTGGRYAFDQQPAVGMWNCARLGEALMVAEGAEVDREAWQAALDGYWPAFNDEYARLMRAKLGLATAREEDPALLRELLTLMQADRVDYTSGFRALSEGLALEPLFRNREGIAAWKAGYEARVGVEGRAPVEQREAMRRVNPKYVLRNWVAQEAIAAAQGGAYDLIDRLRALLAAPFEAHPGMERFAEPPSPEARHLEVSCSS